MNMLLTLGALGTAGVAALPALREAARRPMDDAARAHAPGRFAELSQGCTHYDWLGPARGPVAVCVHGLTTPSFVWLGLAQHLGAMGYRVLVYDLYGRGFSDAPRGPQTPDVFCHQLDELLAHEELTDDLTLMGYSMGGAIATAWTAQNTNRLRRLVLIAPAGLGHDLGGLARLAADWPFLGDWAFHMAYPYLLRLGIEAERSLESAVPDLPDRQLAELTRRGYLRSVLASLRGTLRHPMIDQHRDIAATRLPVSAVWGREDSIIPLRAMGQLAQYNREARQVVIDGAGHGLTYTHAGEVAAAIRDTWEGPVI